MHHYRAYDLHIDSDLELPELLSGESGKSVDLTIRTESPRPPQLAAKDAHHILRMTPDEVVFSWETAGMFTVRGGNEIIVSPAPDADERILRLYVLGSSLGMVLTQRLGAVFHASVVALSSGAVAFIGEKGYGKSTMAAALSLRGNEMISDDLLVLEDKDGKLSAKPGFPQIKLWPDSAEAMGNSLESMAKVHPSFDKRAMRVSTATTPRTSPLLCVYLLGVAPRIEIEKLGQQQALLYLMPHWYGARFGTELISLLGLQTHFQQCLALAKRIPVFTLKRPDSLPALQDVARRVEEHARRLCSD